MGDTVKPTADRWSMCFERREGRTLLVFVPYAALTRFAVFAYRDGSFLKTVYDGDGFADACAAFGEDLSEVFGDMK